MSADEHSPNVWIVATLGLVLLLPALLTAAAGPQMVQRPYMNERAARELLDFKREISTPTSTLVVAPHGLEWWTGYFLGTPVRSTIENIELNRYQRVLFLRTTTDCPPDIVPLFPTPEVTP